MLPMMEENVMSLLGAVTFAVALSLPLWLALEEIVHRFGPSAGQLVPASGSSRKRSAKVPHPHPA